MTVEAATLEKFSGKQVILHLIEDDGSVSEKEGKVEDASEVGMAFKERGKRDVDLVLPTQIEEIALAPSKPKKLTQKTLKPQAESTVRQHLLDRHGYDLSVVNKMTDEQAAKEHDDIDHDDLGHKHEADDDDENGDDGGDDSSEA